MFYNDIQLRWVICNLWLRDIHLKVNDIHKLRLWVVDFIYYITYNPSVNYVDSSPYTVEPFVILTLPSLLREGGFCKAKDGRVAIIYSQYIIFRQRLKTSSRKGLHRTSDFTRLKNGFHLKSVGHPTLFCFIYLLCRHYNTLLHLRQKPNQNLYLLLPTVLLFRYNL